MSHVLDFARILGQAIVESDEYRAIQVAEKAADENPEVRELMARYEEARTALEAVVGGSANDFAEARSTFTAAREALEAAPEIQEVSRARGEFSQMMKQVNQILEFMITGEVKESGCSGNCGSCGGCH